MSKQTKPPSRQQIEDWQENPVTEALLELCREELKATEQTARIDCFVPGEPQKTQENFIEQEARERIWESWVAVLSGDWSYFEIEEEEEDDERDSTTGY